MGHIWACLLSYSHHIFLCPALYQKKLYLSVFQSSSISAGLANGTYWYKAGEKPRFSFSPLLLLTSLCLICVSSSCQKTPSWSHWNYGPNLYPVTTAPGFGDVALSLYSSSPSVAAVFLLLPISGIPHHLLFSSFVLLSLV